MKIKILKSCSGAKFSFALGTVTEVADELGRDLVGCGFAEEIKQSAGADTAAQNAAATVKKAAKRKKAETETAEAGENADA